MSAGCSRRHHGRIDWRAHISEWSERRVAWTLFFAAFLVRVAWVATLPNELMWIDEREYAKVAMHIASGDGYVSSSYRANPVVPAYLAAFFASFGESLLAPRIGQAALGAAGCVLALRIGTTVAGPLVGALAGVLLAIDFGAIYSVGVFYTTCLASVLGLAFVHLLMTARDARRAAAAGIVLGLAALTRSTFLVGVAVGVGSLLLAPSRAWALRLVQSAAFVAATAAVIAPWSIRNYLVFDQVVLVSSGFGETLWKGNNEVSDGGAGDRFIYLDNPIWTGRLAELPDDARHAIESKYDGIRERLRERRRETGDVFLARDAVLAPVAKEWIAADPTGFAHRFFRSVITLFSAYSETETSNSHTRTALKVVRGAQFYPLLLLASVGAVVGLASWRRLFPLYTIVGAWTLVHGVLTACTRFRLDVDPILIVFSALGVHAILSFAAIRPRASDFPHASRPRRSTGTARV